MQVAQILGRLSGDLEIWRSLESKYRIDLFCGLFMEGTNEGLQITPETLHALGERGISLGLDMYGSNS